MEKISRKEAIRLGLKFYFTGKPCKRGHIEPRYVTNFNCKKCSEEVGKSYYEENKDAVLSRQRDYYKSNRDEILEKGRQHHHATKEYQSYRSKKYYEENKDAVLARMKRFREENPEHRSEIQKRSYEKNKEKKAIYTKEYYRKNKDWLIKKGRELRARNRDHYNKWQREYLRRPHVKAGTLIRSFLRRTIEGGNYKGSIGYTPEELRDHLESLFEPGMSWDNHTLDGWHVDHIIPVSYFTKNGVTDPSVVNALINLKPVWASENLSKGANIEEDEELLEYIEQVMQDKDN